MAGTASRYLYLVRHGEAKPDQSGLTERGRRQAELLGKRLRDVPFAAVRHSPLPRAVETAQVVGAQLEGDAVLEVSEAAGDYIPHVPSRAELPADSADFFLQFVGQFSPEEQAEGPALAVQALTEFTGPPVDEDRHDLVITHNFQVAWLVTQALDAPKWRWLTLNHCNASLTVIRYQQRRPASLLFHNDMRHLPAALRWTGFPADFRI